MKDTSLANGLSDSEQLMIMGRMYDLLSHQTVRYLAGDSTSIPVETAEELFHSMTYTIRLAMSENDMPARKLLMDDLNELLRQGQRILQDKLPAVRGLWERACLTLPQIQNDCLHDTLKGMECFFKHYDLWYFAHQIPCAVDYPLCVPVSEELQGVSYIEQWLHHLLIENWILSKFQSHTVHCLLSKIAIDYREYPLNLCEQPIINAVGLALLGRSAVSLKISDEDCHEIENLLLGCNDLETEFNRGVACVIAELYAPKEAEEYMRIVLCNTLPRIRSALQHGHIGGVFIV